MFLNDLKPAGLTLLLIAAGLCAGSANAAPLDPNDYTSLGFLGGGSIALDTTALTYNGGAGGVLVSQGGGAPDIAVFTFDGGSTLGNVIVTGANPLAILFHGAATIAGLIDVGSTGRFGSAGAAAGGTALWGLSDFDGEGPGGGSGGASSATVHSGGAGGGFGTAGGDNGAGQTSITGGAAYGDPLSDALWAGSGGGGGGVTGLCRYCNGGLGGAGGGAVEIGAISDLILDGASIVANGANGGDSIPSGGGGGSGGGIFLHSYAIDIRAGTTIAANGGAGGNFGAPGGGACGGAGRIEALYNTDGSFSNLGSLQATYGAGGNQCDLSVNVFRIASADDIGSAATGGSSAVPLPAVLPLYAGGLGLMALLGWRRRRT